MSNYKDKVILIVGGQNIIDATFVEDIIEGSAQEVRILWGSETAVRELRDTVLAHTPEAVNRLRCYIGDKGESEYLREAAMGAGYVLCLPTIRPDEDCDRNPADACGSLLKAVVNVIQTAVSSGAEKVVVVSPEHQNPLVAMRDMLAVMIEKTVVAEGRYNGPEPATKVCCVRISKDTAKLKAQVDYAFTNADNADIFVQNSGSIHRIPCTDIDLKCEDNPVNG